MSTELGAAEIDVVPSLKGFKGKLEKQMGPQLSAAGKKGGERLGAGLASGVKKHIVGIGATIAAGFAVKKIVSSSLNAFKDWTLGVIQMKRVAGGSVVGVSQLRFAMQESGVDTTKATTALGIFSKKLAATQGDAKKTKAMTDLLGVGYLNAAGHIKPLTVLLPRLADRFKDMEDGPEKSALAMQLFGKSGRDLLPFLNKGSEGIAELRKESDRLGLTLSQKAIDKFSAYKKAAREWDATNQGLKVTLGAKLLPILTKFNVFLTKNLGPGISKIQQWVKTSPDVKRAGALIGKGFESAQRWIKTDVGPALSEFIKGMQDGTGVGGAFASSLKTVVGIGRGVTNFFRSLPSPVAKTLVKVAFAALAVNKLSKAMAAVKASSFVSAMTSSAASAETAGATATATSGRFTKLAGAAKAAAGIGGMLLLTDATNRTSKGLGVLEGAAGGAALGFSVGGPWGAAIGGAAGGLLGIFGAGRKANSVLNDSQKATAVAKTGLDSLSDSLIDVTKGYDAAAKAQIRATTIAALGGATKAADVATQLGLSLQTVVNAAEGSPKAINRVRTAFAALPPEIASALFNTGQFGDSLSNLSPEMGKTVTAASKLNSVLNIIGDKATQERIEAIVNSLADGKLKNALAGIAPNTVIKIGTEDVATAKTDIINLAGTVAAQGKKMSATQIRLLAHLAHIPQSEIDAVIAQAKALANQKYLLKFSADLAVGAVTGGFKAAPPRPGGADGDPSTPYPRVNGGSVTKGRTYIVGERRPELFVPNQSGHIEPRVSVKQAAAAERAGVAPAPFSGPVTVVIDDIEFSAYIDAKIDDRVSS